MPAMTGNMKSYEETVATFRWQVPSDFNFAFDVVDRWADQSQHPAMVWVDQVGHELTLGFDYFRERSNRLANSLTSQGIAPGDRVMLLLPRIPAWWEANLGLMKSGAVSIPGTTLLTPKDLEYRINASEARGIIIDDENAPKVVAIADKCPTLQMRIVVGECGPGWASYEQCVSMASSQKPTRKTRSGDPAIIYFTSGTTGFPKMVLHTHASYPFGHIVTGKFWLDLRPGDLHWNVSDNGWAKAAWSSFLGPWNMGATIFVQDCRGKFEAVDTLSLLEKYKVTTLCAPPTAYRMLVLEDLGRYRLGRLRHCVSAGEPLNPEVIDAWERGTGLTIRDGYGQTESVLLVGNFPPLKVRPGSMGKPSPGFQVSIIDDEGLELPAGREGDIAVKVDPIRPLGLFAEYWKNPDGTASCHKKGWYLTGDRAYRDEEGYFWFVGRADDVIISAGYRIGPFEIESALVEHPAVAEAAVVASPDEIRGEIVKAFVILAPGYAPSDALAAELQEHVKRVTAPYKYPRAVEFVQDLPKTISGKIRRKELRDLEHAKRPGGNG